MIQIQSLQDLCNVGFPPLFHALCLACNINRVRMTPLKLLFLQHTILAWLCTWHNMNSVSEVRLWSHDSFYQKVPFPTPIAEIVVHVNRVASDTLQVEDVT